MNENPFPGMNPYLEQYWGDIHTRFMVYASDQINEQLPNDLMARVEESVSIDEGESSSRSVIPDVKVVERRPVSFGGREATVALADPCLVPVVDELPTERHLEIIDRNGERVVTAIELLGRENKTGRGRLKYQRKQREYICGGVNLVEIDLLRAGRWVLAVDERTVPAEFRQPYRICVWRLLRPEHAEPYKVSLRDPLPNIAIPLRPQDADVALQLQPLLNECYRRGRYGGLDYELPPVPALRKADAQWADALLRSLGLREPE